MKDLVYVIGDIHGQYPVLEALLAYFDPSIHQLILLGDLNDRGKFSKKCFELAKILVEKNQAIYLKGNHEDYLFHFLQYPEDLFLSYLQNGGGETIKSLLHPGALEEYSPTEIAMMIQFYHKELIQFITNRPLYFEWENYIFVHAGADLTKKSWQDTSEHDFLWIREPFFEKENKTGKKSFLGIL